MVSDVAAATAGDTDFCEGLWAGFVKGDSGVWVVACCCDRAKKARRPTADNGYRQRAIAAVFAPCLVYWLAH